MVSIIILTFNQLSLTRICLNSIRKHTKHPYELIMVDNASSDGTVDYLKKIKGAKLILNPENKGFARGVNQGIRIARGDFILLLNNDTIVAAHWLDNLLKCINSQEQIGIVGPRTNYAGGAQGGIIGDFSGLEKIERFSRRFNQTDPGKWFEVELIVGFCMLLRREVIDRTGLFDEGYQFGMFEDNDYCRRALAQGFRLVCAGDTFVYHIGSPSFQKNNLNMALIFGRNKKRFEEKWQGIDQGLSGKILFVNSGIKGIPQGYSRSIVSVLQSRLNYRVVETWPQHLTSELIIEQQPDILLVFHGNYTPPALVRRAKEKGIICICWIVEDPYELDVHTEDWLNSYNYIFTNEIAMLDYYRKEHVYYLPWCTNPLIYQPQKVGVKYRSDLCFVGMGFQNRVEILNSLVESISDLDLKLIGNWSDWGAILDPALQKRVLPVISNPEEIARYYAGAKINLNIHRDPFDQINVNTAGITANSINNRCFDISGCGGFQLIDHSRRDLELFFTPGEDIIVFEDAGDLSAKIRYYLKNDRLRRQIANNAYFKTITCHTFNQRLAQLFNLVCQG